MRTEDAVISKLRANAEELKDVVSTDVAMWIVFTGREQKEIFQSGIDLPKATKHYLMLIAVSWNIIDVIDDVIETLEENIEYGNEEYEEYEKGKLKWRKEARLFIRKYFF